MREMWQLPGRSGGQRMRRAGTVIALFWALVAIPLTSWLWLREPAAPPIPPERTLSVMEHAAVESARTGLTDSYTEVHGEVSTAVAKFSITETVQPGSGDAIGRISAGSETADMFVTGGTVFLRGNSAFWSTIGVPTNFGGWVAIGDLLGNLDFPLGGAAAALAPSELARVVTAESNDERTVYRTEKASATFTAAGIATVTFAGRTVEVKAGAADSGPAIAAAKGESAGAAKLTGSSGALTVSEPAKPRPAPASSAAPRP